MDSDTDPNALIRIGLCTGAAALIAAALAHEFDEGLFHVLAMAAVYVFGVNSILLLGYELQERTVGLFNRSEASGSQPRT